TAVTREVLLMGGPGVAAYLESQLRLALAPVTDNLFLSLITAGAPVFPSQGSNAIGARLDLRSLLQNVTTGTASRLFLITTPLICKAWATLSTADGASAFPNMNYDGGNVGGIRVISSDGCPNGQMILADASGIAAAQEGVRIDTSSTTSLD